MMVLMRSMMVVPCLSLLLAAAASAKEPVASKELLIGSWSGKPILEDEKTLLSDPRLKDLAADKAPIVVSMLKQQFAKTTFKLAFAADGTVVGEIEAPGVPQSEKRMTGAWEVAKTDGARITVKITPAEGEQKDKPNELTLTFTDEKSLSATGFGKEKLPPGVVIRLTKS